MWNSTTTAKIFNSSGVFFQSFGQVSFFIPQSLSEEETDSNTGTEVKFHCKACDETFTHEKILVLHIKYYHDGYYNGYQLFKKDEDKEADSKIDSIGRVSQDSV